MSNTATTPHTASSLDIAIIGMSCRVPGANTLDEFWENLKQGKESLVAFENDELLAAGIPEAVLRDPDYVKVGTRIEGIDLFDAGLFGFNPREAEILDPQHRVFLELAWEVLESAGYAPQSGEPVTGVYAGVGPNSYLFHLLADENIVKSLGTLAVRLANEKDSLATMASYKLNLRGPSFSVQTACSTSLVAVHLACQGLLAGECEMALAGGVSISMPPYGGYRYENGGILSPDGHCRAFDAKAKGTVPGSGACVVLLKRLEDALAAGDSIWAVIKGSAINNDGSLKVAYTAPSIEGQMRVIRMAQAAANISSESISYVETQGTGTPLGDPIEIAALTQAFRSSTRKNSFCALGSVKTNIGHANVAAGAAGLIKAALALKHRQIPASLHFENPNPEIDFDHSPFYVNTSLRAWEGPQPRRAAVNCFGIGGTNAHLVLEEAPERVASGPSRFAQVLLLSAKTQKSLSQGGKKLVKHLVEHNDLCLADVAYTLQIGRQHFAHRRIVVCHDMAEAIRGLQLNSESATSPPISQGKRKVVFLFPGQEAQRIGMGKDLYKDEPVFREVVDRCCAELKIAAGIDLKRVLYSTAKADEAKEQLLQTAITQPAIFVFEYALAQLLITCGVRPAAMIGHGLGEYVAACLAGVMTEAEALRLAATRGRLMQDLLPGSMLAAQLTEEEALGRTSAEVSLAAVNGPRDIVFSGSAAAIDELERALGETKITCHRLKTSHAFHSWMMDPVLGRFGNETQKVRWQAPEIPYVSGVTGNWVSEAESSNPGYWVRHLREPVRFAAALKTLMATASDCVFLEIGPGQTLHSSVPACAQKATPICIPCMETGKKGGHEVTSLITALGRLWVAGVEVNWRNVYAGEKRQRVPLPQYAFDRQRYWIGRNGKSAPVLDTGLESARAEPSFGVAQPGRRPRPDLSTSFAAPVTDLERAVGQIWEEMLGVQGLGVDDSFSELGGHSLLAIRIATRLREMFEVEFTITDFYRAPTIRGIQETIIHILTAHASDEAVEAILTQMDPPGR